jgi:NAD-dependent SIR2 family protein deacetylase
MTQLQHVIEQAADAIRSAKYLYITAGAGMGVDSGLPDFRGDDGFWKAYPALHGYPFQEMANPRWFHEDPDRAWGFYGHRLNLYRSIRPHDGFAVLRKWASHKEHFVFTSNVDGAFQKAGFSHSKINECHGSLHHVQYVDPNISQEIWSADTIDVDVDMDTVRANGVLPMKNNRLLRPNVLMFGDWDWVADRSAEQEDRREQWFDSIDVKDLVVIEMGAGTAIPTVRNNGNKLARQGATLIRINPREAQGTTNTISIYAGAKASLLAIDELIN